MNKETTHRDEVDWLIINYKELDDDKLKAEAFEKLKQLGYNESQIDKRYYSSLVGKDSSNAFEKAWKKQLERNQHESYSTIEKVKIFIFAPHQLFHLNSGLIELKKNNYRIKFRQRLILQSLGIAFYLLILVGGYYYSENKRMQAIKNADITEWENNRK